MIRVSVPTTGNDNIAINYYREHCIIFIYFNDRSLEDENRAMSGNVVFIKCRLPETIGSVQYTVSETSACSASSLL